MEIVDVSLPVDVVINHLLENLPTLLGDHGAACFVLVRPMVAPDFYERLVRNADTIDQTTRKHVAFVVFYGDRSNVEVTEQERSDYGWVVRRHRVHGVSISSSNVDGARWGGSTRRAPPSVDVRFDPALRARLRARAASDDFRAAERATTSALGVLMDRYGVREASLPCLLFVDGKSPNSSLCVPLAHHRPLESLYEDVLIVLSDEFRHVSAFWDLRAVQERELVSREPDALAKARAQLSAAEENLTNLRSPSTSLGWWRSFADAVHHSRDPTELLRQPNAGLVGPALETFQHAWQQAVQIEVELRALQTSGRLPDTDRVALAALRHRLRSARRYARRTVRKLIEPHLALHIAEEQRARETIQLLEQEIALRGRGYGDEVLAAERPSAFAVIKTLARTGRLGAREKPMERRTFQVAGVIHRRLVDALAQAFPSHESLHALLEWRLRRPLNEILASSRRTVANGNGSTARDAIICIVDVANAQGWTLDLVNAACASRPGNAELDVISRDIGLRPETPVELERLIVSTNTMLDVHVWRTRLAEIEGRVCRIRIGGGRAPTFGTGFLIGPELLITNYHVLASVIEKSRPATEVTALFDYKRLASGEVVSSGTPYELMIDPARSFYDTSGWLVDASPPSPYDGALGDNVPDPAHLDYALVRLRGEPGNAPIGPGEPDAPSRGWIEAAASLSFEPDTPLFIVQHPKAEPIKLALETRAILGMNANGTRIKYRTNTEAGSSGSPCFDQDWQLVALHQAGDPDYSRFHAPSHNQGIPFAKIVERLLSKGIVLPRRVR